MRAPAISPARRPLRHGLAMAALLLAAAMASAPALANETTIDPQPSGVALAGRLAEEDLQLSADVALSPDRPEPLVGSFTVGGLTYAVVGEGEAALVAVAPATLAAGLADDSAGGPSGDPSGAEGAARGIGSGVPTSSPRSAAEQVPSGAQPLPAPSAEADGSEEDASQDAAETLALPGSIPFAGVDYALVAVGPRALAGCGAAAIVIPASVASVDGAAFRDSSVAAVEVADGNAHLSSYDGMLFDADRTSLLLIPEGKQGAARIPKEAEVVEPSSFSHSAGVEAIDVEAGSAAFSSRNGCLYDATGALLWAPVADAALGSAASGAAIVRGTFNATQDGVVYHYLADDLAELQSQGASLSDDSMSEFELDEGLTWRNVVRFPGKYPYVAASPTRHLLGWSTKPSGGSLLEPGTRAGSSWDVYAIFGPKVTWDASGGESPLASSPAWEGEPVASPVPTREGHRCLGWSAAPDGEVAFEPGALTPPVTGDVTYYAQWEELAAPVSLSYDLGSEPGGEAGSWPEGVEAPASLAADAGPVALPEPVRQGYLLAGWSVRGHPGSDLLSRGDDGSWSIDSSKLPDCADEDDAVTLVARWTAKVEVEAPLEATFLYDLARDGASESSTSKDAWVGEAQGASLLRNRSAVPVRVSGMQSVAAEGASVLLGPGGSTLAEAASGGPKVLSVFPTTDPATGTRADAEGAATDGAGDDVVHRVDLSLSSTLLEGAFASAPDGSPDAERRAAWTVPAAQSGLNGVAVPGTLGLGFRLNLGEATGATVDRSALLAATGGDATGTAKVPIAGLAYCFALEGTPKPLPSGTTDDPLWVEVTQGFIDENGLQGSASPGVYGLADIKAAANDMASRVSADTDPNDFAAIEAEAGQSPYWPLYRALMDSQGRDAFGNELAGPYFKLKVNDAYHDVHVLGICQDALAEPRQEDGRTVTRAGLTFGFRNVYEQRQLHNKATYTGGWHDSELRAYLNSTLLDNLGSALSDTETGLTQVRHVQQVGEGGTAEATDTIFLPSHFEVYGHGHGYALNQFRAETSSNSFQYQAFAPASVAAAGATNLRAQKLTVEGLPGAWFTRTASDGAIYRSCDMAQVSTSGKVYTYKKSSSSGIVPCFAI